jgi:hypothetical protein
MIVSDKEVAPALHRQVTARDLAHREGAPMDTAESSAPHAHPSTEEQDDTLEAHYAGLERPHACNDGWITLGQIALDPETGEEVEEHALYLCRRCTA